MPSRKERYQSKKVFFQGQELELFSLDGHTWSSRKDELEVIKDRQENARVSFEEIKSGVIKRASEELAEELPSPAKAEKEKSGKKEVAQKVKAKPALPKKIAAKKVSTAKTVTKSKPVKATPKKRVSSKKTAPTKKGNKRAA